MNREVKRLDESHDQMSFQMQSPSERDAWMRSFPNPIPSTHELRYRWTGVGGMWLVFEVVPKSAAATDGEAVPVTLADTAPAEGNATPPAEPTKDLHADAREQLIVELQTKELPDLRTLAAEKSVTVSKNMSKAQVIAAIVDKLTPAKTE